MAKKKSYNPFKMWGSYIGSVLYLGLIITLDIFRVRIDEQIMLAPIYPFLKLVGAITNIFTDCSRDACWGIGIMAVFMGLILVGFLVGWGIHSLIRKLRKDNSIGF